MYKLKVIIFGCIFAQNYNTRLTFYINLRMGVAGSLIKRLCDTNIRVQGHTKPYLSLKILQLN